MYPIHEYSVGQTVEIFDERLDYYAIGKIIRLASISKKREFYLVDTGYHVFHVEKKRLTAFNAFCSKNKELDMMFDEFGGNRDAVNN